MKPVPLLTIYTITLIITCFFKERSFIPTITNISKESQPHIPCMYFTEKVLKIFQCSNRRVYGIVICSSKPSPHTRITFIYSRKFNITITLCLQYIQTVFYRVKRLAIVFGVIPCHTRSLFPPRCITW